MMSVQQADAGLDHILSTTRMLGQSLYFLTINKSDLSNDQKRIMQTSRSRKTCFGSSEIS